jgi:hypothetical protein
MSDRRQFRWYCPSETQIAHAPQPEMWCPLPEHRTAVPERRDAEWSVPNAWRPIAGRSEDNKHALKHGPYSTEAIARRREVAALIRAMRALACATEEVSGRPPWPDSGGLSDRATLSTINYCKWSRRNAGARATILAG